MDIINANGKLYANCGYCNKLVRVNKPILGSMHVCLNDEERKFKELQERLTQQQLNCRPVFLGNLVPNYEPQTLKKSDNNEGGMVNLNNEEAIIILICIVVGIFIAAGLCVYFGK